MIIFLKDLLRIMKESFRNLEEIQQEFSTNPAGTQEESSEFALIFPAEPKQ